MADLHIHDLVVEYPNGGNPIRPVDGTYVILAFERNGTPITGGALHRP